MKSVAQVRTKEALLSNIGSAAELVVDARSLGRFKGVDAEPWPGLACGHIPGDRGGSGLLGGGIEARKHCR